MKTNHVNGYKRMGKVKKMKKKTSIFVVILMLISLGMAVLPTAEASQPHAVKGVLYLTDGYAPAGVEIRLVFDDGTETTYTYEYNQYGYNTNYNLGFWGHDGKRGDFEVMYNGQTFIPVDNQSIYIEAGVTGYIMDLHINTSSPVNSAPNEPSSPSPTNGASGININTDLSWTGGDPDGDDVTYDVWFNGVEVSTDQPETNYDPGTLAYKTTYN